METRTAGYVEAAHAVDRGQPTESRRHGMQGMRTMPSLCGQEALGNCLRCLRSTGCFFANRAPDKHEELITSLALLERVDTRLGSPATAAALSEGHGLVALSERDALRAVDYLRLASAQWQALDYLYNQVRVLVGLGRALSETAAADEARVAFDQALNLVDRSCRWSRLPSWGAGAARSLAL